MGNVPSFLCSVVWFSLFHGGVVGREEASFLSLVEGRPPFLA
jgi:hypothetical protein